LLVFSAHGRRPIECAFRDLEPRPEFADSGLRLEATV
jgi:hypothetical protein